MRPSLNILQTIKQRLPIESESLYKIPSLESISVKDLPNNGFGKGSYHIAKTKFGHWPVYKKVQNTKISTEIKRIQGDIVQFKHDLIKIAKLNPKLVTANTLAGYINIKGDQVETLKQLFEKNI